MCLNIQSISSKAAEESDARFGEKLTPNLLGVGEQAFLLLADLKSLKQ